MNEVKTPQGIDLGMIEMQPYQGCPIFSNPEPQAPDEIVRADLSHRTDIQARYGTSDTRILIDSSQWSVTIPSMFRARIPVPYIPEDAVLVGDPEMAYETGIVVLGWGVDEDDGFCYAVIVNLSNLPVNLYDGTVLATLMKK